MAVINPIIFKALNEYLQERSDVPKEIEKLVQKLLDVEKNDSITKEGIEKIYDQILEQSLSEISLIKWSEKFVHDK